ncbi:MAG: zf-HC2 domain-containing protein [bacterium]
MTCPYRNKLDKVVAYVREELPPPEQEAFEAHFLGCDECSRAVLWVEKTTLVMQRHGQYLFAPAAAPATNPLARYADRVAHALDKFAWTLGNWRPALGYAAVVLIFSAGFWLFYKIDHWLRPGHKQDSESSFVGTEPAVPEPAAFEWPQDLAPRQDVVLQRKLDAFKALYREKKFAAVADSLALLASKYPDVTAIRLLRGISLFQDGQFGGAIQELAPLAAAEEPPSAALWFLAQAYLQEQKIGLAKDTLQKLLDRPQDQYHDAARELWPSLSP